MSLVFRWLRRLLLWIGPVIVVLTTVVGAFVYWTVATPTGTRWALSTATGFIDSEAQGVSGTLWAGVNIGQLRVVLPGTSVTLDNVHLKADWRDLLNRRLHVNDLSASKAVVELTTTTDNELSEPFQMPALPVQIAVDRLALGEFSVIQDGTPLPISVEQFSSAVFVGPNGAQLTLQSLDVGHELLKASLEGEFNLKELEDPWLSSTRFTVRAKGLGPDSPLCANRYLSTLPVAVGSEDAEEVPQDFEPLIEPVCEIDINVGVEGSLDALRVVLDGQGQDMVLHADANLTPRGAFPLKDAKLALQLADGSSLNGDLAWNSERKEGVVRDRLTGNLHSDRLDVGQLVGSVIPPAILTAAVEFDVKLRDRSSLTDADLNVQFAEGSMWNKQPLTGGIKASVINTLANALAAPPAAPAQPIWTGLQLAGLDMDVKLGKNHLRGNGSLGTADSRLKLDVQAPALDSFWPKLPGGAELQAELTGTLAAHTADLKTTYTPSEAKADAIGSAPVSAHVVVDGGWGAGPSGAASTVGWRGKVSLPQSAHAGFGVRLATPVPLSFLPHAMAPEWQWQVGAGQLELLLESRPIVVVQHAGSRGGQGRWETRGGVERLSVSRSLIDELSQKFQLEYDRKTQHGGVTLKADKRKEPAPIDLAMNWDLKFNGVLEGQARIERLSGDILIPVEPSFPLGLQTLVLELDAKRAGPSTSRLTARLNVDTAKMGQVTATADTLLHTTAGGGFALDPNDAKTVAVQADIDDLSWISLFTGDAMEFGGSLHADLNAKSGRDGQWVSGGAVTGENLRILRLDDGVRLVDGTLTARLADNRFIVDKLSFPATLRVKPNEWRTAEWVSTNPEAKGGSLTLSGEWSLREPGGFAIAEFYRYPILQRSDRYAMVSGKIRLDANMPVISITGDLVADAGWFDLDMLSGVPTLDGDVVVIRAGEEQPEPGTVNAPLGITMDLNVDLGKRFYITGYGVNSGLVGELRVMMSNGRLTGIGALRTRGGAIEAYGQRLQLRRGTITFQGDIMSPVLDIEALRTGLAVEAGVRVAGTPRRPRIDLVSYPAVSEVEKLSWLLMGHGLDDSGGDMAMLFSVGSSFLGSGEPFYRRFGIDEVTMRSGELGSAGSILPAESVVSGLDSGTSDIERKFVMASKTFSNGITLAIQQALSDTGTVGRASYRLAAGLTAELTMGTTNGLALVYRWFSRD